jgi:hypothetical protein
MRIRLAAMLTSAMLLLPVAAASAHPAASDQPQKKCPSLNLILNHCD